MEWVIAVLIVVACLVISISVVRIQGVRMLWKDNFWKIIIFMLACMEIVNIGLKLVLFILTKMGGN